MPQIDLDADIVELTRALVDTPSVSGDEAALATAVETALGTCSWLDVRRIGNSIVARTDFGHARRVVVAGHLDTVPAANNQKSALIAAGAVLPTGDVVPEESVFGLGSCDMKGGLAVALQAAATVREPAMDVTYVFYECEEVASARNGLGLIGATSPELLAADVAVLLEPSNAQIEAGCQGTLTAVLTARGVRAHSARSWRGANAIHTIAGALDVLRDYEPRVVEIDGLKYREGLNAVRIDGGIANNVIPDEATLTINYRYAPNRTPEEAERHITELFSAFDVEITDNAPGALPGLDRLADLIERFGGQVAPKFGWTDVSRFSALGIPAVNLGPGDPSLAHSANEYVPTAQLRLCRDNITNWLMGK